MILTYTFPNCWLHVNEDAEFLRTVFRDGRCLDSVPDCVKDPGTARAYGYGRNMRRLWREHDLLHHTVGTLFGLGMSTTLWSVVHEDSPDAIPHWARLQEERFIGHVHRWLNLGEWQEELWPLQDRCSSLPLLRRGLRQILSGQILDITPFNGFFVPPPTPAKRRPTPNTLRAGTPLLDAA